MDSNTEKEKGISKKDESLHDLSRNSHDNHLEIKGLIESLPYAEAEGTMGGKMQILPLIIRGLPSILKNACIISPNNGVLHVDENGNERMQSNAEIFHNAKCILAGLRDKGLSPGTQIVIQVDDQSFFLTAFWGVVLGGFVPVPLPVPGGFPVSEGMERVTKVWGVLDSCCMITDQAKENYKDMGDETIFSYSELINHPPSHQIHKPDLNDVALLQFSSGSTGDPKGVMLTHRNIITCIEAGSMSFNYVAQNDYRPMIGYIFHFIKRLIFKNKKPGLSCRLFSKLADSTTGDYLKESQMGRTFLDTLLILSGNRVSAQLDMRFDDVCMANWMPYSHVMGLIGFHMGPTAGGFDQVALSPKTFIENPALFLRLIQRYKVSFVPCPNFALEWLTAQVADEQIEGLDLSSIKMMGNGSEPISAAVTRNFINKFAKYGFDPKAMCMGYGLSEATAEVTFPQDFEEAGFYKISKNAFFKEKIILPTTSDKDGIELADLGVPLQGMKIRIVDDNDQLLHENMVGHIQIQGPTITTGYLNNPEASKDLFCKNWLRTGDMGFIIKGRLVITGRLKDIIFVHGQNIYAHDIENNIKKIPGQAAKEFAVTGLRHYGSDSEKIILFVNTRDSNDTLTAMLSRVNKALVADMGIMVDFLVPVDEIPRTPTAKIKRFKLRQQFENDEYTNIITVDDAAAFSRIQEEAAGEAVTEEEEQLIKIWKDVTQVDEIGRFDNFFDLGGNSLKATKITSRIREEFGIDMPLKTVFENQTVNELYKAIMEMKTDGVFSAFPPIVPLDPKKHYELSHAQERLWMLDQMIPESPLYNISGAVLLENMTFDFDLLKKALQAVVERHDSLRTTFLTVKGSPMQHIAKALDVELPIIDIIQTPAHDIKLQEIIAQEKLNSFNLSCAPLFRVKVVRLSGATHAFIIVMHHIISDGWSMGLLVQEVMSNYFAFINKMPNPFPELAIQYKDFAHWQKRIIESNAVKKQEDYWIEKFKGQLPLLNLPTDYPRPAVQTQKGATQRAQIDVPLADQLKTLARNLDVTPFMLTLTVFNVLLHKLTGQEDMIIGSPVASRNNAYIEPLIGFFVNMLPLRCDLSGNPDFKDLLKQTKQTALEAYANQDYPFDKLVEVINPARDLSRSPVFDIVFEYREVYLDAFIGMSTGDVSATDITGDDPMAKFDMVVTLSEGVQGIAIQLDYNADLFEAGTINRMIGYFLNLTREILTSPHKPISNLEMLDQDEKRHILEDFNVTALDVPKTKCMHTLFKQTSKTFAARPAVFFREEQLTYEALDQKANQLARFLAGKGVGPNDFVGLLMGRGAWLIICQLAAWKAGSAFVPIDPDYPSERIRYMVEDCQAKVLICLKSFSDRIPDADMNVLYVDDAWDQISAEPRTSLEPKIDAEALAYMIYTSGSTGRPKGSRISHRNLANLVFWHIHTFEINEHDRASHIAGVAFDATVWELWPYLIAGSCMVPLETTLSQMLPEDLALWLEQNRITRSFIPTKLAEVLLNLDLTDLSLKTLFTGGDRLSFIPSCHQFRLINNYGPTETTVVATSTDVTDWDNTKGSPPIGKPISNLQIYVLDKYQKPVPVGVVGELYVGGNSVGTGYINDPEKTKNAFVPNPFSNGKDLLYRTGDLVRWLPDGNIDFIGRADFQVEIRGYRVELGEIESVFSSHEEIEECVALNVENENDETRLVSFYVAHKALDEEDCKQFLQQILPAYMIPSRFIHLDKLPMTPNGKLDRAFLLKTAGLHTGSAVEYVAPRDKEEHTLAKIWQELLSVDKVGIHDNFFDIGGNSLKATQVVSRIREELGIELPLKSFFEHNTLAALSAAMTSMQTFSTATAFPPMEPAAVMDLYDVSNAQKRLWYIDKVIPNSPFYNITGAVLLESTPVDMEMLKKAFQAVADRHESLRTTFITIDNTPKQKISDRLQLRLGLTDLSRDKNPDEALKSIIDQEKLQPFNLEKGPLFRAQVVRLTHTRHAFVITMHHIISDGWSVGVLVQEAMSNYLAFSDNRPSPFPELRIQYKDFSLWQNRVLVGEEIKQQKDYWLKNLQGELPVLNLPTDHPRPAIQTQNGATQYLRIDAQLTKKLRTLAGDCGVTPFILSLSLFKVLIYKLTGQEDIIIGTPIANRNHADIEPLIGFFVNVLPMRTDLSDNPGFTEFLDKVKQTALNAYANQDYPFDKLVEALNPVRDISRSPVFDVVFDFHEASASPFANTDQHGIHIKDITGDELTAKFDITVTGNEDSNGITVKFVYNTDLFEKETINRMMNYYLNIIKDVISAPEKPLSDIEMMSQDERMLVLKGFNNAFVDFPKNRCTHQLFETQAEKTPDRTALIFGKETISYARLNARANKIARYLRAHGVGKETYVAIMVERSFDMLAGVLGIMKAGGAYVPIESAYPSARIKYMIDEIQAPVAIVHENLMDQLPPDFNGDVLCLEKFWAQSNDMDESNIDNINDPDDIAYVIYTSGSTGKPKGVMVPHIGITRLVINTNYADITEEDVFLQVATFAFDAATMEFWGPLLNGGRLVLASAADAVSSGRLADLLLEYDVTILFITTVMYNQLVDARPDGITKLKSLLTGGESHSLAHMKKGLEYTKPGTLVHVYGPTENTTYSTYFPVDKNSEDTVSIPIGYPLANSTVYILDKHLNPVPVGVVGEIYVGGYGLARGYLNDTEKTANAFIANPIPEVDAKALYKTGDLGKWLPDGSVDFLGRIDHQVKIRGHRIELGEIEAKLREQEAIKDAVVLVKALAAGNKMLIAYYVSEEEIPIDTLRSDLKENLPNYMIPQIFVQLDALPLNQNGKVDKAALPEPKGLRPEMATDFVAPSSELELAIAETWKAVLGIDKIGINDNFFDLGGDSIISLQVVNKLNDDGYIIEPKDILQFQTVAELAKVVEVAKIIVAEQGPVVGTMPLTPVQNQFFNQEFNNKNHFNKAVLFESKTQIDEKLLKTGLQAIVDHHDVLRSSFSNRIQELKPLGVEALLVVKDVKDKTELEDEITALQTSFDIEAGPVFGAGLYHYDDSNYLAISGHHLVIDDVSLNILVEDLLTAYITVLGNDTVTLPKKTTSYKEWANRLSEFEKNNDMSDEISFWEKEVSAETPKLPADHDLGQNDMGSADVVTCELDRKQSKSLLTDANTAYNTSKNDLLITALAQAIQTWSNNTAVAIDLTGCARAIEIDEIDISRTVGNFSSRYPVVLEDMEPSNPAACIKYIKEKLHTVPHSGFYYGVLRYIKKIALSMNPAVSFSYRKKFSLAEIDGSFSQVGIEVPGTVDNQNQRGHLIDVVCADQGHNLVVNFIYSKNQYKKETIENLADIFSKALTVIIDHCLDPESFDITPSDFDLVDMDQDTLDDLADFD